jgi:hypothetical protein
VSVPADAVAATTVIAPQADVIPPTRQREHTCGREVPMLHALLAPVGHIVLTAVVHLLAAAVIGTAQFGLWLALMFFLWLMSGNR